ncbi:MAG: DUF58 domain-containing protein [Candidatus Rokubacteria bacterium]|nr:DUF58 domain-containing protein [Candidatus Rokubacteria bacterium]
MTPLVPDHAALRRLDRLTFRWRGLANPGFVRARGGPRPGSSRELLGVRAWESGDDMRDLDWAATLRFGRAHVRVYERAVEGAVTLVIDTSASMAFGAPPKLAYARALACALGHVALAHHDRVGALAFANGPVARLPAGHGRRQWGALRDFCAAQEAEGRTAFDDVARRVGGQHGLCLILSDFCTPEVFAPGLARLRPHPVTPVALHLVSAEELDADLDGELELVDCETGAIRSGTVGPNERAAYRAGVQALRSRVAAMCRDAGVPHVALSTSVPVVRCLEDTLVRAGILTPARS